MLREGQRRALLLIFPTRVHIDNMAFLFQQQRQDGGSCPHIHHQTGPYTAR